MSMIKSIKLFSIFLFLILSNIGITQNEIETPISTNSDKLKERLIEDGFITMGYIENTPNYKNDTIEFKGLVAPKTTLNDQLEVDNSTYKNSGLNYQQIITDNDSYSHPDSLKIKNEIFNSPDVDAAIWMHLWRSNDPNQKVELMVKIKEVTFKSIRRNHPKTKIDSIIKYCSMEKSQTHPKGDYGKSYKYLSVKEWIPGMRFVVKDYENNPNNLSTSLYEYNNPNSKFRITKIKGDTLIFKGYETRENDKRGRSNSTDLLIFSSGEKEYEYVDWDYTTIRGLAYLGDTDKARKELTGKSLYILFEKAKEFDMNGEEVKQYYRKDKEPQLEKFTKVKVVKIEDGFPGGPVKIFFQVEGRSNTYARSVNLSDINVGEEGYQSNNFDHLFMFEHPKKYYNINDEMWNKIINKKIEKGMTKTEIRLCHKSPYDAAKFSECDANYEQWMYGGLNLLFKDDVLFVID